MAGSTTDGTLPRPPRRTGEPTGGEGSAGHALIGSTEAESLYRLLVESVRDYAIFVLDRDGYILTWNPGAQRIKGYERDEIVGHHFSIFYPAEARESHYPDRELEIAAAEGRFEEEGWRIRKDGSRFWASVTITALRDATGELRGYAKVTRDLTERRRAQQQAVEDARRIAEVETENRTKMEFLAAMSHELRTPLNAIGGYTELISLGLRGPVTPEQVEDLERIRRSQQHLLGIINDLLNFSRLEAGQVRFDLGSVPLDEVVDAVAPMIEPQAATRGLAFEHEAGEAGVVAHADRARVEQILLNLLSNAVKFTAVPGEISVAWAAAGDLVVLRVTDTGPGIEPGQREAIFEPFRQLGRTLTSAHEGTGLGLAISRDLARAMGGDLVVESAPEIGSTFTLSLPRA